jgi:Flp pilus assembly pilin Flp
MRLVREEHGQDLVEYALLLAFFGIAVLAVWTSIADGIAARYGRTRSGTQSLWDTPPPGGGR